MGRSRRYGSFKGLALLGKQKAFVNCSASLMATDLVSRIVFPSRAAMRRRL